MLIKIILIISNTPQFSIVGAKTNCDNYTTQKEKEQQVFGYYTPLQPEYSPRTP
jgi:hypothetical protein